MRQPTVRQLARKMGVPVPELLAKMKAMGSQARKADDVVDVDLAAGARSFFWPILALVVILLWIVFGLWLAYGA